MRLFVFVGLGLVVSGLGLAFAQAAEAPPAQRAGEAVTPVPTAEAPPTLPQIPKIPLEEPPQTLNVDVAVSSVYVFRGLNMFQRDSQWDQHAFIAPSLTYNVPGTDGLTLAYWGAYQITGPNVREKLDAGVGAENDLTASYSRKFGGNLTCGLGLTSYIYPAAKKEVAGSSVPLYLEPFVFATYASIVDIGLKVTYMHGVQDAVSAYRYVYFNPTVGKTMQASKRVSVNPTVGFGYKLFTDQSTEVSESNTVDLLVGLAIPLTVTGALYVKPFGAWAWTNLPGITTSKEMVAFGAVSVGANY